MCACMCVCVYACTYEHRTVRVREQLELVREEFCEVIYYFPPSPTLDYPFCFNLSCCPASLFPPPPNVFLKTGEAISGPRILHHLDTSLIGPEDKILIVQC